MRPEQEKTIASDLLHSYSGTSICKPCCTTGCSKAVASQTKPFLLHFKSSDLHSSLRGLNVPSVENWLQQKTNAPSWITWVSPVCNISKLWCIKNWTGLSNHGKSIFKAMFRKTLFKTSCKVWVDQSNCSKNLFRGETADYPSCAADIKQSKTYFKTGRDVEIKIAYKPGLLPCSLAGKRLWFSKTVESSTPLIHLHQVVSNHISSSLSRHAVSRHPLLPDCLCSLIGEKYSKLCHTSFCFLFEPGFTLQPVKTDRNRRSTGRVSVSTPAITSFRKKVLSQKKLLLFFFLTIGRFW